MQASNTMGSKEHHKSSFVAKCLSSLQNMCNVDSFRYPGPLSILLQKGPFQGGCILVRFIFWTPKNKFSHPLVCGRVWPMALSCWCIGWAVGSREANSIAEKHLRRLWPKRPHESQTCKTSRVIWQHWNTAVASCERKIVEVAECAKVKLYVDISFVHHLLQYCLVWPRFSPTFFDQVCTKIVCLIWNTCHKSIFLAAPLDPSSVSWDSSSSPQFRTKAHPKMDLHHPTETLLRPTETKNTWPQFVGKKSSTLGWRHIPIGGRQVLMFFFVFHPKMADC